MSAIVHAAMRILLVEDNPGDVDLTRDALEASQLPFTMTVAVDGADAIDFVLGQGRHAQALTPDLVLLDLNLPKRGGREVLAEIRRHERVKTTPVVVLTSSDAETDIAQSYALGANCYVTKPIDLSGFQAVVRAIGHFWSNVAKLPPRARP